MTSENFFDRSVGGMPFGFGVAGGLTNLLTNGAHIVETAIERGVRVFDTAPSYGDGRAEEMLGGFLRKNTDVRVMTKAGIESAGITKRRRDFSPQAIERSIERSRQRLQRDVIDVVCLHGPDPDEMQTPLFDTLQALKQRGWVRQFGIAGRGEKLLRTVDHPLFEVVMCPVHIDMDARKKYICECIRRSGKFVVAIEVLTSSAGAGRGISMGAARRLAKKIFKSEACSKRFKHVTVNDAFRWPIKTGAADFVISSTTLRSRLLRTIDVFDTPDFGCLKTAGTVNPISAC